MNLGQGYHSYFPWLNLIAGIQLSLSLPLESWLCRCWHFPTWLDFSMGGGKNRRSFCQSFDLVLKCAWTLWSAEFSKCRALCLQDLADAHKSILFSFPAPHPSNCFLSGNHLQTILTIPPRVSRRFWARQRPVVRTCPCFWVMSHQSWQHSCPLKALFEGQIDYFVLNMKWFL